MSVPKLSDHTRRTGFVALVRSINAFDLLLDPNAFTLLALIALRARYTDSRCGGITRGQMFLGRKSAARELGIKQGATREATKRLIAANYITTRTTKHGTVITLVDSTIFDIAGTDNSHTTASKSANQQPTDNQQAATNKEGKKEEGKSLEDSVPVSFPEVLNTDAFKAAWCDWMTYSTACRLRKWVPQTVSAKLAELAAMGESEAIAAIRGSIGNGWKSIYPPNRKADPNHKPTKPLFR